MDAKYRVTFDKLANELKYIQILPFTIEEARTFLNEHKVDTKWHQEIIDTAGTVFLLFGYFKKSGNW